jgi:hypothetical protein
MSIFAYMWRLLYRSPRIVARTALVDHPAINLTAGSKTKPPFIVASKVSSGGAGAIIPLQASKVHAGYQKLRPGKACVSRIHINGIAGRRPTRNELPVPSVS